MVRVMSFGSCLLFLLAACVDAEPCTATDNADGTYTIECPDGSSFTLSDGEDGQDGAQGPQGEAGADGEPCTATDNGDGTYTIDCPDGTSVTVSDGADGADGSQGTQGETGAIGQDGEDGADGQDGYSALVSVDSEVGDNCFGGSTGTRIQSGSDNGDGGGIARDGILQAGEVDSTIYLCIDCAGDLNGTDSSCVDCAGVFNGGAVEDACGVCGGDGSSCGPEGFVLIEAGTFTMGSPESELGREPNRTNETQHQVTLTNDFFMSDHEVTQAEWQALIGNNPSQKNNGTCPTCPVEFVNWWEALHYANALSEFDGLTACYVLSGCNGNEVGADKECTGVTLQDGSGNTVTTPYECEGYRLPTEAEWEYAARAGTTTAFYNGSYSGTSVDPNADAIAWYSANAGGTTQPVKGKTQNAWGLYDMSGNVWEWVWDWYADYSGDITNPTGPSSGNWRVKRSGGWDHGVTYVRVAARSYNGAGHRINWMGFRLARTVQ